MDIVDEIQRVIEEHETYARLSLTLDKSRNEILNLREDIEDMHRRERSTAIQQLGNEGQWNDLVAAKDEEIERLRKNAKQDAQYLLAYHRICQKHGIAPSSSDLIEALKEGK